MINKILNLIESIPKDKLLHSYFGYVIADIIFLITNSFDWSVVIVGFVAVLKELYDKFVKKSNIDALDIIATLGGSILKLILVL